MSQVSNDCLDIIMLFILFILFLHDSHRPTREIKKASSKRAHQSRKVNLFDRLKFFRWMISKGIYA
jgi:hypothetical protein